MNIDTYIDDLVTIYKNEREDSAVRCAAINAVGLSLSDESKNRLSRQSLALHEKHLEKPEAPAVTQIFQTSRQESPS